MEPQYPRYQDLPAGDARGVFGEDDVVGSLNRLTPQAVQRGAALIRTGEVFSLNAPLNWPDPPLYSRAPVQHTVFTTRLGNRDDFLDGFYPQASSQWDAFPHIKDPEIGFYNGHAPEDLGVDSWARRGIAGRAVLFDMARWREDQGRPLHWRTKDVIGIEELESFRTSAGFDKQPGDIILLRTGWTEGYQSADVADREAVKNDPTSPGLDDGPEMLEYLWDWGVSAIASDNISVEALPPGDFPLHPHLLNRLGIPIGELWWLDSLADACASDGRYEFFLTSAPLNIPGGVGSPANALAIR